MGFGQSKKKESLESVQTDRGSRSDRGSKHSSNYSDDSERFVSPPTSLVNGFNTNLFEFPSRSNAIVKPTSDCHNAQDGVNPCTCHTKTVPRPSTGKLETKATITFQDETAKHSSHGKSSTTLQKALQNQGVKDVKKTNRVNNHNGETQPNKLRPIGGNNNYPDTAKFGKGGKDTASSIQERPGQQQHFNVGRLQDAQQKFGQQLQKETQPSEQGQQPQRLQQRQQQTQLQTVPQQSLQQQTRHKHQEKQVQLNQQVHQQQEQQQGQKVLSTSDEGPRQHQQFGRQKPSQQQHKPPMQEPNLQQKNHQLSTERVCVQQQQKQTEQNEKQHINEQQKLSLQKQPKEEKPQLVQQQPNKQLLLQKHSVHLHNQQAEGKLQQHNSVSDQQQQLQHNLKEKQTKLPQCEPQQNQQQDKQPSTALLQHVPHHNQPRMQSQTQQQQQQLSQQQQKEKLPEEKQQKKGRQQEKLPPQQPVDQQRIEEKSSKKTKKLSKKEQRALDWTQKQGEGNQCDLQQPNEKQLHQQSQKLNHTDLPEQNARQGKEEPHQQSIIQVQGTPKPLPQQQTNHSQDTREQEQPSNKVAITVRLTYEAGNKNSSKQHVVEDTLKGKPIPLMDITFPKHGANCTLLRTSKLQATARDSYTPVNSTTSGASKERVGKTTPLSVETIEVSDHSPDNTTTTQSETSKKISKRPLTPFFPRKKKSLENCQNTSTDDAFERDLNQKDNGEKQHHPKNQQQHRKENEQQHQQKQQEQNQQQQHLQQQKDNQQEHQQNQQQQHLQQQKDKQQQHQNQQRQQQKQPEHQQQRPSQQQGQQDQPQGVTPFVFQGKERPKLKPVHRLPDQHSPEFSNRAAVLQAQFSLNQPSPSPKTARKQKPVEGDAQMEKFKLIQKNDSTTSTTKKSDCCAMNFQDSSVTVTHCVAPWAIVCDKMPDQVFSDTPLVGKKLKKKVKCKTSKTSHREGHGFFSKIFGKKTTTEKNKRKHDCSETASAEMERLTQHMEDLRLSSSTSVHQDDATKCEAGTRIEEVTPSTPEQEPDQDSESTAEDSDSSADLEPPSCVEAWEIAEDVVEKALFLLPVPTAGKYVVPDSPFEPEFVKRLVADALEAKRGLEKVKEDQKLMEKFRDALLKFFEDKEISDVIPPCNHPPGANQCNLQPVIQPLVDILRQVLHEPTVANDQPKNEFETQREAKRQSELQQPRPRKYIKVRRRLKTGQAPTQLLIRFCQACGDTKQPDGRKLMSCGRCKDVVYCSKECQSVDWITHKFTCRGGDRRGYCKHHGT